MLASIYVVALSFAPKRPASTEMEADWSLIAACVIGCLLLVAVGAILFLAHRQQQWVAEQKRLQEHLARNEAERQHMAAEIQRLSPYQKVVDAEATAAQLRAQAEAATAQRRAQTEAWAGETRAQVEAATTQLRAQAEAWAGETRAKARSEAERVTTSARQEAERLAADANRRAQEIAGSAVEAVKEAKRLEQTAQAMKNVIEGYGDRYLMPTAGLLDELAQDFGFTEAGKRLKEARAKSRDMISDAMAATCDYAEANRKQTAIAFVLDAFNGKVDTILADVRHDNIGTLQQKIRDAAALVGQNGRAFRDARILPAYLDARLEELRWAVVVQELKRKEREEQKQIKERMREEEKAQREIEKARRDAEKEEEALRKAMAKAQSDIQKSSAEERAQFEQKLLELTERLRTAEEKNQRAISLAQQTKRGHVYVISNVGSFGEDVYKIGMTRRFEPMERVHELGDASVPFEFDVHAMIKSEDAPALEHALHKRFVRNQVNKVNPRREFFRLQITEICQEINRMGLEVAWTLAAEAREFRETQATERALANKTIDEGVWVQQQIKADLSTPSPSVAQELVDADA